MTARIGINGYGTIGKRVADAVAAQKDMTVAGVVKTRPTFEAWGAVEKGYRLFASNKDSLKKFQDAGLKAEGTLENLLDEVELIVDCTPEESGYRALYDKTRKKAVWQGGEEHAVAGTSFNAYANYEEAVGKDHVRVVSCNTTGLIRTLYPLHKEIGIRECTAVMIRRSADPQDIKRGPINAIIPELEVPSHHGPDVQSVVRGLNIQTMAVKVSTTMMHLHSITAKLEGNARSEDVLQVWNEAPRIRFFRGKEGIQSTAQVMEYARDLSRNRGDLYEIAVWKDGTHVVGDTLYYFQAIHQESDVIPENVDCIRAMLQLETDKMKSIQTTDRSLGIRS